MLKGVFDINIKNIKKLFYTYMGLDQYVQAQWDCLD